MRLGGRALLSAAQVGAEHVEVSNDVPALSGMRWTGLDAARTSPPPVTQARARVNRGYRADIDGLRGLAILSVVAFHSGLPHVGGGFVGVDVFFVISGYLISSHMLRDLDRGTFSLKAFYERRAKRILPALFVVIASCYILAALLLAPMELRRFAAQAVSALTSTSNFYFWRRTNYFATSAETQPLLMTWSLAVEEQFYLFFPLLMIMLHRWSRKVRFFALGSLSAIALLVAVIQVARFPVAAFYLLPSRWWELGCGTLLGLHESSVSATRNHEGGWRQEGLGILGAALLLWAIGAYNSFTVFPGLSAVPPVLGSVCILSARGSFLNRKLLSFAPLVAIGLISYSWYLWHWPLLSLARTASGGPISSYSAVVTSLFALLLAAISYYMIEGPFRRRLTQPRTLLMYGVWSLLLIIPGVTIYIFHGFPHRYPHATAVEEEATQPDPTLCIESGASPQRLSETCRPDTGTRPTLAVLGDSHASALARYLRPAGRESGWNVTEYTRISCPQLGSITRASRRDPEEGPECLSYNRKALDIVLADTHISTVLLGGYWSAPFVGINSPDRYVSGSARPQDVSNEESWQNLRAGLNEVVRELQAHGKTVLLTTDVPQYKFDPLLRGLSDAIPLRKMIMTAYGGEDATSFGMDRVLEQRDLRTTAIVRSVAEANKVQVIDLAAALCADATCRYVQNGQLLYMDSNHLSIAGARFALGKTPFFTAHTY